MITYKYRGHSQIIIIILRVDLAPVDATVIRLCKGPNLRICFRKPVYSLA